jgi:hypothetical protein
MDSGYSKLRVERVSSLDALKYQIPKDLYVVTLTFASWNLIIGWLTKLNNVRRTT